jgi:hypothetical protein
MIVGYFDIVGVFTLPAETNPPLVIDADAVLPDPAAFKHLQTVSWRNPQIQQISHPVKKSERIDRMTGLRG